jgi:hypothetical protein
MVYDFDNKDFSWGKKQNKTKKKKTPNLPDFEPKKKKFNLPDFYDKFQ